MPELEELVYATTSYLSATGAALAAAPGAQSAKAATSLALKDKIATGAPSLTSLAPSG